MIREILIVEDRNAERDTYQRIAEQYGTAFAVANLAEALAFLSRHQPSIVISDLHLHDGNKPLQVATQIYQNVDLHHSRLYFMTTDLGDTRLTTEIREHFPSIKIIEKSRANFERLFADFRHDERGHLVETMDMGSKGSHDSIRQIVHDVVDEILRDIGLTRFEVKMRVHRMLACEARWEKALWVLGVAVLGALAVTVYNFTETAFLDALRKGLEP